MNSSDIVNAGEHSSERISFKQGALRIYDRKKKEIYRFLNFVTEPLILRKIFII